MALKPPPDKTPGIERGVSPSRLQEVGQAEELLREPLTRAEVLARDVPWDNYRLGGLLSQQEVDQIKAYDKKTPDQKHDILDEVSSQKRERDRARTNENKKFSRMCFF
jgi:hypothetical protein